MEYYFTDGRVVVRGDTVKRLQGKQADYLLSYKPIFSGCGRSEKGRRNAGSGMQQAIDYAQIMDLPFAYASNGSAFLEHDMLTGKERELTLDEFPTPEELWPGRSQGAAKYSHEEEKPH